MAELLHCRESEITFTGGGTEAVNTVIRGLLAGGAAEKDRNQHG